MLVRGGNPKIVDALIWAVARHAWWRWENRSDYDAMPEEKLASQLP